MSNPTSNYGFVLPTSSDLVTDLPADFEVALQGVDTRLKALNPETTLGDISFASATANTNTRLPIGTTGQVLSVVENLHQLSILYLKNSINQFDLGDANSNNERVIKNAAILAGHIPFRGISSTGTLKFTKKTSVDLDKELPAGVVAAAVIAVV